MTEVIDFAAAKARRQEKQKQNDPGNLKNCMGVLQFIQDKHRLNNYEWQSILMKFIVVLESQERLKHEEFLAHVVLCLPQSPEVS